jgi:hypothetical protein
MPAVNTPSIAWLNYTSLNSAETDIFVQVPVNEGPGAKSSVVNFTASFAE